MKTRIKNEILALFDERTASFKAFQMMLAAPHGAKTSIKKIYSRLLPCRPSIGQYGYFFWNKKSSSRFGPSIFY